MRVLGIETSCDETAAAVLEVKNGRFSVLSNVVASQVKIHAKTGGVVPEVAAREHAEKIVPVVQRALNEAGVRGQGIGDSKLKNSMPYTLCSIPSIDAIAVTVGPGLVTSLLVGVEAARTLAYLWKKPLVAVNHTEGHICANWLSVREFPISPASPRLCRGRANFPGLASALPRAGQFPILCLIVSGGHTELVLMRRPLDYKIIGATRDDAVGECFDKVAKMLGLGYPGGPIISKLASKGDSKAILFPRPMIGSPDFDFSFSGIKTAALYWLRDHKLAATHISPLSLPAGVYGQLPEQPTLEDFCASFEQAAVEVLISKTIRAAKKYKVKTIMLGGGVAANQHLREQLVMAIEHELPTTHYLLPPLQYTGDNAAMIAAAGYFHALKKDFTPWAKLEADPNLSI